MSQIISNTASQLFFIKSYGCQMNEYDSGKIADILVAELKFIQTPNPEQADLILLNTCSVRFKAEEKLFSDLGRLRKIKAKKPRLVLGVGGCVASHEKENIIKRAPYVDFVFGPQTLHRIPTMYLHATENKQKIVDVSLANGIEKFDYFPRPNHAGPSANVSIMEGCNKFCSYCIVPYTRGREVSRPVAAIMEEISDLVALGVRELNLLGQNVNAYRDIKTSFADLLYRIAEIPEILRIRFTTSHPTDFNTELISCYSKIPKLANHLHLPLQSGSNQILTAMRRGYTAEQYLEIIRQLREHRPNINISSDFIVGFPGESSEDFQDTMHLINAIGFDHSFSFIYSPRPNTPAVKLPDLVPLTEKKRRLEILQNQISINGRKISNNMIGSFQEIIVEGTAKQNHQQISGRTENNRVVNVYVNNTNIDISSLIGQKIKVKITSAMPNSLGGEMV